MYFFIFLLFFYKFTKINSNFTPQNCLLLDLSLLLSCKCICMSLHTLIFLCNITSLIRDGWAN